MAKPTTHENETCRLSVEVSRQFRRRVRLEAIRQGVPVRTLVVEALSNLLFRRRPAQEVSNAD